MFTFTFEGDVGYRRIAILSRVSLHVGNGEGILLSGSNGSGKTTLLGTCAGLLHPLTGVARRNGQDTRTAATQALVAHIGEPLSLFGELTVKEHAERARSLAPHLMDTAYFRQLSDAFAAPNSRTHSSRVYSPVKPAERISHSSLLATRNSCSEMKYSTNSIYPPSDQQERYSEPSTNSRAPS